MKKKRIGIIDLGINNLHSIKEACNLLGYETELLSLKKRNYNSDILILPGIGSFRKAMQIINKNNIKEKILEHLSDKRKFLIGICLGMQIFFSRSEEFGSTKGLNFIDELADLTGDDMKARLPFDPASLNIDVAEAHLGELVALINGKSGVFSKANQQRN